jgi:hypothetical protein
MATDYRSFDMRPIETRERPVYRPSIGSTPMTTYKVINKKTFRNFSWIMEIYIMNNSSKGTTKQSFLNSNSHLQQVMVANLRNYNKRKLQIRNQLMGNRFLQLVYS